MKIELHKIIKDTLIITFILWAIFPIAVLDFIFFVIFGIKKLHLKRLGQ
jgi:hypothetical protein